MNGTSSGGCDSCVGTDEDDVASRLCQECLDDEEADHAKLIAERDALAARVTELSETVLHQDGEALTQGCRVANLEAALIKIIAATHNTGNDDYLLECRQIAQEALGEITSEPSKEGECPLCHKVTCCPSWPACHCENDE